MTSPTVPALLQTACNDLDMARDTLHQALDYAFHSAMHATHTAAIKRILFFTEQAMGSTNSLIRTLKRQPDCQP